MTMNGTVVTAIGMTTPVGLNAAQSCAAIRAGVSAISELDFAIETDALDRVPLMGCSVRPLTDGYLGLGRWTRLAVAALKDLFASARLSARDLDHTALYLALPPVARSGLDSRIPALLGSRIARWTGFAGAERRTRVCADGHASAARALEVALIDVNQGAEERAIVCGIDSLVEPDTLEFLHSNHRLKTDDQVDGFVAGEGAACLLLERGGVARARGAQQLVAIEAVATAVEPVTIWSNEPSPATGLSQAILNTLNQLADRGAEVRLVVTDLNGEVYRAKEFGTTAARVLTAIPGKWAVWHPADCIGDTGAASFAVSSCLSVRALAQGYAKCNRALVIGSSDDGLRGAAVFSRVPTEA